MSEKPAETYPDQQIQEIKLNLPMIKVQDGDRGAALVEWGLLVVMIAIVALVAVTVGGNEVSESYSEIASAVTR